jgi:AcrR family transcriptional regulator
MATRRSYPKGALKREEILREVLEVISRIGYENASMKQVAQAVGLSVAGLQHHFPTKDDLYMAVLQARDEVDRRRGAENAQPAGLESLLEGIEHNREVAGLVRLYVRFSAEATTEGHPAREYFASRLKAVRHDLITAIAAGQAVGEIRTDLEPSEAAETLLALSDGAQMHWLLLGVDMTALMKSYLHLIRT